MSAEAIEAFLSGSPFAVVGASTDRSKYGSRVLRAYLEHALDVFPVNPRAERVEDLRCYPDLASLPERPHGVSIVTPPAVTEDVVREALELGVRHLWMQPGAESATAVAEARAAGASVLAGGPCVLVELARRGPRS